MKKFKIMNQDKGYQKNKNVFKMTFLCTAFAVMSIFSAQAQLATFTAKGKVMDKTGLPIDGANISVSEQNVVSITDEQGRFSINAKSGDVLMISATGYKPWSIVADTSKVELLIKLEANESQYNDYVDLPYMRMKSKHVTAATSTVFGSELEKHPITVLENSLMGTTTGVATFEFNSEPGWSTTETYIRGLRTMNGNNRAPLVIIDNVERDLSFLDAFPIDNITIIKDAAVSAIYGMRGANGVIYVTTKRGKAGKTQINLTQEVGYQQFTQMPQYLNAYEYTKAINRARILDGNPPSYSDQDVEYYKQAVDGTLDPSLKYKYVNTDWRNLILRDQAPVNRTNLNLSGGNDFARYFVAFTYLRQEGMYNEKWTNWHQAEGYSTQHTLDRFNLRSNIDMDLSKTLNVSLDLGGRMDIIQQPYASTWDMFTWSAELHPTVPVFTPRGDFTQISDNDYQTNPAARIASSGIQTNRRRNIYSNVRVSQKLDFITPGLSLKGLVGFDAYNTFQYYQTQDYDAFWYNANLAPTDSTAYTRRRTGTALSTPTAVARDMSYNINTSFWLDYSRTFGNHDVNAMLMTRSYKNVIPGFVSSTRYLSYSAIANYIYKDRYIFQGVGTLMGSDNYQSGKRYGFFPGVSLGWIASQENFLKNVSGISLLKFRASYGETGANNTGTRRYPFQNEYTEGNGYNFGTSQSYSEGAFESATGNLNTQWEVSDMVNGGLDFDLWNGKLYGNVDAFKEWRSKILVTRSTVPDMFGVAIPQDPIGKVESWGGELVIGHKNKIGAFNYFIEGNISYAKNKITEMDELTPRYPYQTVTGTSIGQTFVYIFDKWFQTQAEIDASPSQGTGIKPGNAKFVDINKDGKIDQYDMIPVGYTNIPEIVTSLKTGFEFKGFEARVLLVAELNRTVGLRENTDESFFWNANATTQIYNTWGYWTDDPNDPRNINAKYPRLSMGGSDNDRNYPRNQSTIWLRNGDLLSIRNVEIGYSLPKKLIAHVGLTKVRFYASGYNLYTFNYIKFLDPESPMSYIWQYPKTKSYTVGLNLSF